MWTFDTPFEYTGGSVVIKICGGRGSYVSDSRCVFGTSTSSTNEKMILCYQDGMAGVCSQAHTSNLYSAAFRPNIRFDIQMGPALASFFPNDTLFAASSLNGDIFTPSLKIRRRASDPVIQVQYIVRDASNNIVFEATNPTAPYSN